MRKLYFLALACGFFCTMPLQASPTSTTFFLAALQATIVPTFNPIGPICQGSTPPFLPGTSLNGITGSWSPAVVNTMSSGSYMFIPNPGQNAVTVTLNITVVVPPSVILSGNQNICVGTTTTFSTTHNGGTWSSSNTAIASINSSSGLVTGLAAGTATMIYTVIGTAPCTNVVTTRTVTISALPNAVLSGNQHICVGTTTLFSVTTNGGVWTSYNTDVATVDPTTGLISGLLAGTCSIAYTLASTGECPSLTVTRTVTVSPNATLQLTSPVGSDNQTICIGDAINTLTYATNGATSATVNGLPIGVVGNYSAGVFTLSGTPTMVGVFPYTVATTGSSCTATTTGTITVLNHTDIILTSPAASNVVCVNVPIIPITYDILNTTSTPVIADGILPPGISASFSGDTYTLIGTPLVSGSFPFSINAFGTCNVVSQSYVLNVLPSPTTTIICNSFPNGITFDWTPIPGATNYQCTYSIDGGPIHNFSGLVTTYTVSALQPTQTVTFAIVNAVGVPCFEPINATCVDLATASFEATDFSYFPNPVSDLFTVTNSQPITHIELFNGLGQIVYSEDGNATTWVIDASGWSSGLYYCKITAGAVTKGIKVIIN